MPAHLVGNEVALTGFNAQLPVRHRSAAPAHGIVEACFVRLRLL